MYARNLVCNAAAIALLAVGLASTPAAATPVLLKLTGTVINGFDTGVFEPGLHHPLGETAVLSVLLDTMAPSASFDPTPPANTSALDGGLVSASFTFQGLSYTFGPEQNSRWVKINDQTYPWGIRDGLFGIAHLGTTNTGPLGPFISQGEFQFQGAFATDDVFTTTVFDAESASADPTSPDSFMVGNILVLGSALNPGTLDIDIRFTNVDFLICGGPNDPCGPGPSLGIPEPASWTLMISGLGLAGVALRRRRRAANC